MRAALRLLVIAVAALWLPVAAQVNTEQVLRIGQNALYFEDYMLSIQYFNQVIEAKPYLAQPFLLRAVAKINLDDYTGAEADASRAITLNPFLTDAYEVRGVARQNQGRNRGAIEDYDRALDLLPRNRQLLFNKALAQMEVQDYDACAVTFNDLLRYYPNFANGYLGRARLLMATEDTVAAKADIDRALEIDSDNANAYIMRADIAINSEEDYAGALDDIDRAIRLMPNQPGLYINRAFLRYYTDDYRGAMADYDYALSLDPLNKMALFNRGLLQMEVEANDLALESFNKVLELDPDDYRALYNRALIHRAKGNYAEALADIGRVADRFPEFPGAVYIRADVNHAMGNLAAAERDYERASAMSRALDPTREYSGSDGATAEGVNVNGENAENQLAADPLSAHRFRNLLTVDDNAELRREYNNSAIRGRVQDRNMNVEIEPMFVLSFYTSPTELRPSGIYVREVDDLNATRILRFVLAVTNVVPPVDEATASRHFQSIDYYSGYLSTHTGRPVDYIGRAIDFLTVRDYAKAEEDATRAVELAPDLALGYMVRAQARHGLRNLELVREDLTEVTRLSPSNAVAWFNLGNVLFENGEPAAAIDAYSEAIRIKPDFGEAFFNRGYMRLRQGIREQGIADLSKAGELGILPAYNLIKRMTD